MRTKAVPAVAGLMSNRGALIAGAALLALGATYVYTQRASASDSGDSQAAFDPFNTVAPQSVGGIQATGSGADVLGSIVSGGAPGLAVDPSLSAQQGTQGYSDTGVLGSPPVGATPSPAISPVYDGGGDLFPTPAPGQVAPFPGGLNPNDPYTAELLAQQRLSMEYDFQYQMAQLSLAANVAQANTWLQYQSLQSLNYQSAAALASSFLFSNNQAFFGNVTDASGNVVLSADFAQMRDSKHDRWNETLAQNIGAISAGFNSAVQSHAQTLAPPAPWGWSTPQVSSPYYDPYSTAPTPAPTSTPTQSPTPTAVAGWTPPTTQLPTTVTQVVQSPTSPTLVTPTYTSPSLTPSYSPGSKYFDIGNVQLQ